VSYGYDVNHRTGIQERITTAPEEEDRATATDNNMHRNLVKFDGALFELCELILITVLCAPSNPVPGAK